jgi:hypothetical protein
MEIEIINQESGLISKHEVTPTQNNREDGWSVVLAGGNSIFITSKKGKWEARHHADISPQLLEAIGEAIWSYPNQQQGWFADAEHLQSVLKRQESAMQKRHNMKLFTQPSPL